ncbi:type II toxin-antitoxin system prevent-host-death family antitoxin [Streptomyces sp. B21-106]|uniref:type II toxin-antitoxin system Phd/YefM family antitoxin n=1 Tax=unclassified Streptomyces TaxID=2593676 RepID=UPI002FEF7BD0
MSDNNNLVGGTCVAIVDGKPCGREGIEMDYLELSFGVPLCDPHRAEMFNKSSIHHRAREDERAHRRGHLSSFVYFIRLRTGMVKIGYSTDLFPRLKNMTDWYNGGEPIEVLAVIPGNQHLEGQVHWEWKGVRVWELFGEQHYPTPELMDWIGTLGIADAAHPDLIKYKEWAGADPIQREFEKFDRQIERAKKLAAMTEEQRLANEARLERGREKRAKKKDEERPVRLAGYIEAARQDEENKMIRITGTEAKPILAELLRKAENGEEVHLTRYGKTQAVLIGAEQYERYRRNLFSES